MPVPHRIADHYDIPPEAYWVDGGAVPQSADYFADAISKFRRLWEGTTDPIALDIGAGTGLAMLSLERAGVTTFGLEPSPSFHRAALARGIRVDRLTCRSIEDARYAHDSFDFVSFGAVLEHLHDPSGAIASAMQWLRPGGLIYVEVPSADWLMARLVDAAYRMQGLDYTCHLSPLHSPFHLFEFTLTAFCAHAQRNGYEIAHHEHYVGARTYAAPWADTLLRPLMEKTRTGMQLEVWLVKPPRVNVA